MIPMSIKFYTEHNFIFISKFTEKERICTQYINDQDELRQSNVQRKDLEKD